MHFQGFKIAGAGSLSLKSSVADPESEIRDPGWVKKSGSGIRDKHPGSATLLKSVTKRISLLESCFVEANTNFAL